MEVRGRLTDFRAFGLEVLVVAPSRPEAVAKAIAGIGALLSELSIVNAGFCRRRFSILQRALMSRSAKMRRKLFLPALALGIVATPKKAEADLVRAPLITLGTSIALSCSNPGSHQDVAKTPILKNITTAPIKAGQTVHWTASDGDYGSMKLQAPMFFGSSCAHTKSACGKRPSSCMSARAGNG